MTNRLKRILIWLSRIDKCRGFGIQSPWAYAMATNIINANSHADVCEILKRKHHYSDVVYRRLCELMYRLADELQPSVIVNADDTYFISGDYLQSGCCTARYEVVDKVTKQPVPNVEKPDNNSVFDLDINTRGGFAKDSNRNVTYPLIVLNGGDTSMLEY